MIHLGYTTVGVDTAATRAAGIINIYSYGGEAQLFYESADSSRADWMGLDGSKPVPFLRLSSIRVTRRIGNAAELMRQINGVSQQINIPVAAVVKSYDPAKQEDLEQWYRCCGWVPTHRPHTYVYYPPEL